MYILADYLRMMRDPVRMRTYQAAINSSIRPGCTVLDLGAGVGIMGLLALKAGASHVYAIEKSEVIHALEQIVLANKLENLVTIIHGDSTASHLERPVDAMIFSLHGALPLFRDNLPVIADARDRFLIPGGIIIPIADTVFLAPVEFNEGMEFVAGWHNVTAAADFSSLSDIAANQWSRFKIARENILAPSERVFQIDYRTIVSFRFGHSGTFQVSRKGFCTGFAAWFESQLTPEITMSTAPGIESVFEQVYFPFFEAVSVLPGDTIDYSIAADFLGDDFYWQWKAVLRHGEHEIANERHSDIAGLFLDIDALRKRSPGFIPELNRRGHMRQEILGLMNGRNSIESIANSILQDFGDLFQNHEDALSEVAILSEKFSN